MTHANEIDKVSHQIAEKYRLLLDLDPDHRALDYVPFDLETMKIDYSGVFWKKYYPGARGLSIQAYERYLVDLERALEEIEGSINDHRQPLEK